MTKYTDLIERLERATTPNRELDARIALALHGYTPHEDTTLDHFESGHFAFWDGEPGASVCHNCSSWPEYTRSLDAAHQFAADVLTRLGHRSYTLWTDYRRYGDSQYASADIAVPTLEFQGQARGDHAKARATVAAALRALQSMEAHNAAPPAPSVSEDADTLDAYTEGLQEKAESLSVDGKVPVQTVYELVAEAVETGASTNAPSVEDCIEDLIADLDRINELEVQLAEALRERDELRIQLEHEMSAYRGVAGMMTVFCKQRDEARAALTQIGASPALRAIAAERRRQIEVEGWTPEHDDRHPADDLPRAAACYALSAAGYRGDDVAMLRFWPWLDAWWKPTDPRRDLVKAGALITAAIEWLDRAAQATNEACPICDIHGRTCARCRQQEGQSNG